MKPVSLVIFAAVMPLLLGCGPKSLSRNFAKGILDREAAKEAITELTIPQDRLSFLQHGGTPDIKIMRACIPDPADIRLAMNQFSLCKGSIPPGVTWRQPGVAVTLTKSVHWSVHEVTGISDGDNPNQKIVEYSWEFDFSQLSKQEQDGLTLPLQTGKSLLQLYDDGWRWVKYVP